MGYPEVGPDQVFQQVCRNLQWREQTKTFHSDRLDGLPSSHLSGEIQLQRCGVAFRLRYKDSECNFLNQYLCTVYVGTIVL